MREYVLGTVHFPVPAIETYWETGGGSLGVKAMGHWLVATHQAANFHPWWRWVAGASGKKTKKSRSRKTRTATKRRS